MFCYSLFLIIFDTLAMHAEINWQAARGYEQKKSERVVLQESIR